MTRLTKNFDSIVATERERSIGVYGWHERGGIESISLPVLTFDYRAEMGLYNVTEVNYGGIDLCRSSGA